MRDRPVLAFSVTCTRELSVFSPARDSWSWRPKESVPTMPARATGTPSRAAAEASLLPLPPGERQKESAYFFRPV